MVELTRNENWTLLFSAYLKERRHMPFAWGKNDCLNFVCGGIEAITGTDWYADYKGTYHDEEGAKKILERDGGVVEIISRHLGTGSRNILKASRGDVVIFKKPDITAGLVDDSGQNIVSINQEGGLIKLPLKNAWRYWSY